MLSLVDIVVAVNFHRHNRQLYLSDRDVFAPALNHAMYLHVIEHNTEDSLYVLSASGWEISCRLSQSQSLLLLLLLVPVSGSYCCCCLTDMKTVTCIRRCFENVLETAYC